MLIVQPRIGVERMALALPFLLVDKLFAGFRHGILRDEMGRVGTCRCGRGRRRAAGRGARVEARGEAFEIKFLLRSEIAAHDDYAICPPVGAQSAHSAIAMPKSIIS